MDPAHRHLGLEDAPLRRARREERRRGSRARRRRAGSRSGRGGGCTCRGRRPAAQSSGGAAAEAAAAGVAAAGATATVVATAAAAAAAGGSTSRTLDAGVVCAAARAIAAAAASVARSDRASCARSLSSAASAVAARFAGCALPHCVARRGRCEYATTRRRAAGMAKAYCRFRPSTAPKRVGGGDVSDGAAATARDAARADRGRARRSLKNFVCEAPLRPSRRRTAPPSSPHRHPPLHEEHTRTTPNLHPAICTVSENARVNCAEPTTHALLATFSHAPPAKTAEVHPDRVKQLEDIASKKPLWTAKAHPALRVPGAGRRSRSSA